MGNQPDMEKIKCRDVLVGDWISPNNTRSCDLKVHSIEEGAKIAGILPARRLHLGNDPDGLKVSNYGPGKPRRRRVA
ncbi:MAG: hypothetical protein ACI9C1_002906 [Candidatus Aldehydirespiratoraceae bacterium]|jgi:hypothetical protein